MSNEELTQQPSRIETEQALRQMNDDWVKALVRADGATLDRIMADDFFFAYPMEGDDKAQFIDDVTSGDVKVEFLTQENVGVRIWGHTAVLTGRSSAKWYYKGRDFSGHYKNHSRLFVARQPLATSLGAGLPDGLRVISSKVYHVGTAPHFCRDRPWRGRG